MGRMVVNWERIMHQREIKLFMLDETKPYEHQVSGVSTKGEKDEFLSYGKGKFLKKLKSDIRGENEENYYKTVSDSGGTDALLCPFMPRYYQTLFCSESNDYYLCLEDLSCSFRSPSLIDIKMGHVTWVDESRKKGKMKKFPFSEEIKFRICGMRTFDSSGNYKIYGKDYGLQLTPATTVDALELFFRNGRTLKSAVVEKLRDLLGVFEVQTRWRFIASSILIIYDNSFSSSGRFCVKMIDFAHAFPADDLDVNFIEGLSSLINYIERSS